MIFMLIYTNHNYGFCTRNNSAIIAIDLKAIANTVWISGKYTPLAGVEIEHETNERYSIELKRSFISDFLKEIIRSLR